MVQVFLFVQILALCIVAQDALAKASEGERGEPIEIVSFAYPPYMTINNDGMAQRIANATFSTAGIPISIDIYPHARAQRLFQSGLGNAYLGSCHSSGVVNLLSVDLARARVSVISFMPKYKSMGIEEIKKLDKIRFGGIRGSSSFGLLGLEPQFLDSNEQILKMLKLGRLDFGAMIELTAQNLIAEQFPKDEFQFRTLFEFEGQICFRNNETGKALRELFVKSFSTLQNNGEYRRIIESFYVDKDIPERVLIDSE